MDTSTAFPAGTQDIIIIGGAAIGSTIAYFSKLLAPSANVSVVERDFSYAWASTHWAGSGGSRRLFSCPENIAMSNFSIDFIKRFADNIAVDGCAPEVEWHERGYLFVVDERGWSALRKSHEIRIAMGVDAQLLSPEALKQKFPALRVDDLAGAEYSPGDGWFNPKAYLRGMREKCISMGVQYVEDEVTGLTLSGRSITTAKLASGRELRATAFVNAAGPWAAQICEMVGMPLPVKPMRRFEHDFDAVASIPMLPYVKDMNGLAIRSNGEGFSGGLVNIQEPRGFNREVDESYFDRIVRPAVEWRFPWLSPLKCKRTWSGIYEQCDFDGNPIIGNWAGHVDNFFVAAGFSGHGLMHTPAASRAIAELVVQGDFRTLDLSRFGYARVEQDEPYPEQGIK